MVAGKRPIPAHDRVLLAEVYDERVAWRRDETLDATDEAHNRGMRAPQAPESLLCVSKTSPEAASSHSPPVKTG